MSRQRTVRLAVAGTASTNRTYVFTEPAIMIVGRADDCDLRIAAHDKKVSRHHCRFDIDPPNARVRDLGSRNGIQVNGVRVGERELTDGDEIRIGDTRVWVTAPTVGFLACPGYEIVREVGRGAQGVVYLARNTATGEPTAVKVLLAEAVIRPDARSAFLREMENTRALRHPNVVEFRGGGTTGAAFFLACEYCEGGSLDRLVARCGGPLSVEGAVAIAVQVLDALAYAHTAVIPAVRLADGTVDSGRGLVHRDVKPQNILLSGTGDSPPVKLADFGLAKAFDRAGLSGHTRTGAVGGSVDFMPRAQVVNYKFATPQVDVWATAASLYWMLTGTTPRDFPPSADPVTIVLREPAVPIRDRGTSIPPRLSTVIDETLTDSRRPAITSAEELKRALLDAL